jgi:hypothetical protein
MPINYQEFLGKMIQLREVGNNNPTNDGSRHRPKSFDKWVNVHLQVTVALQMGNREFPLPFSLPLLVRL